MCHKDGTTEYDVCIIGAGMFGCAAARHVSANPGLKVCLIGPQEPKPEEYTDREIFGAHYDEGRLVFSNEVNQVYQTLNRESISRFHELEKLSGIEFYTPCGSLVKCDRFDEHNWIILSNNTPDNPQWVDLSSKEIFRKRFPYMKLNSNERAYLDDKGAGYISPRNMVLAQKKVAQLQGCRIFNDIVTDVNEPINGVHEIVTKRKQYFKAKRIILCPGAFINFIRFHPMRKLKVTLQKETAVLLKISKEEALRLSSMSTVITHFKGPENHPDLNGAYILPPIKYPDDMHYLKIGHLGNITNSELETLTDVKEWYQSEGNKDVLSFYSRFLKDMLPDLKVERIQSISCVTCDSPTGLPYIDRLTPTVTVAAVGNSRGAAMCEEVGRLAAQLCVTGKWDSKLSKSMFEAIYEKN